MGISGSGKSTLARAMVKEVPNSVIINRDAIREMLFGYTALDIGNYYTREDFNALERQVSDIQDRLVKSHLQGDMSVILDNTHLQLKYINHVKSFGYPVEFIKVNATLEDAIARDYFRGQNGGREVGEAVIKKQHAQYLTLLEQFDFSRYEPVPLIPIKNDPAKNWCYIFDIDGTLAINNGRGPFEWHRVGEDSVNRPVRDLLNTILYSTYNPVIFILSGRDSICRPETTKWLEDNFIVYADLYMRAKGDNRKDAVVKEEVWREIAEDYYIAGLIDDRAQVIDHARALGLTVFDVANNQF